MMICSIVRATVASAALTCGGIAVAQAPVAMPLAASAWRCGAQHVSTAIAGDTLALTLTTRAPAAAQALRQVPSNSGARFRADGNERTTAWINGDSMMLVVNGRRLPECLRAGAVPARFSAIGQEPGWRLDIADGTITLAYNLGQSEVKAVAPPPEISEALIRYVTTSPAMTVTIADRACADVMSGRPFPKTVTVLFDGNEWSGCGGDSNAVISGVEWQVDHLDGNPLQPGSRITLFFDADGFVSGTASCNRYRARFAITGEGLVVKQPAVSTRRACSTSITRQEKAFLTWLAAARTLEVGADTLTLVTGDGRRITAQRS